MQLTQTILAIPGAPRLTRFCKDVHATFPVLGKTLHDYLAQLRSKPGYAETAERLVELAFGLGERIGLTYEDVLDAYAEFCLTFLREQREFLETGAYRNAEAGFEKVKHEVYENDEYMTHYMLGHLLSCAVFPHHYEQYQFFMGCFVPATPDDARIFEFGPGHGLWISSYLAHAPGRTGQACDVSPLCVRLAQQMLPLRGISPERCALFHGDAVQHELGSEMFDAMIASGLLEHIEDPGAFLRRIRANLKPHTGRLFTMVPTNTAHPDHLVLFTRVEEIQAMYRDAGFVIEDERILHQTTAAAEHHEDVASHLHLGILSRS